MSTQKITSADGVHNISVSGSGKYVLDTYSNLTTPNKIDLNVVLGKSIKNLLTAKNPYENKVIGQTEIFTIKSEDGTDLYCRLIKPSNFDPNKKYPVVVYVYNGPHVQLVTNSFLGGASLWMHYLAEDGYLVFTVDGRGSSNRGKAFEQAIHRQLGTVEIQDQMSGVNWLKKQKFVDANRMGIHGWSFGGFMTTNMMLRTPGTFKVGVAGGPVIDWKLYEVMYTERYMDTPQENPEGYKSADLTQYVKNLQGKLLMIHGTDDDVVVMQHNMKFMKA
jgi:dipeptidyl-peptidase-4